MMISFCIWSVRDVCVHGGTTGQNFVGIEVFVDVDITLHDGTECSFVAAQDSIARKEGWKRASRQQNHELPIVMTWPSDS